MLEFKDEKELKAYLVENVLTSSEAADYLGVSRQALQSLVKRGKVNTIKELTREKLFLKSDLDKRLREQGALRNKYRPYDQ